MQILGIELGDIDFEALVTDIINTAVDFTGAPDVIAGLKNDVEATKVTVTKDETTIADLTAQVADLTSKLSAAQATIGTLTKENAALAPVGAHLVQLAQAWGRPVNTKTKIDAPVPAIPTPEATA